MHVFIFFSINIIVDIRPVVCVITDGQTGTVFSLYPLLTG